MPYASSKRHQSHSKDAQNRSISSKDGINHYRSALNPETFSKTSPLKSGVKSEFEPSPHRYAGIEKSSVESVPRLSDKTQSRNKAMAHDHSVGSLRSQVTPDRVLQDR